MASFIETHPCCDRNEILREPSLSSLGDDLGKQLDWLVSTGHVVAFTNGVFSKVEKYPKYGPQWKKRPEKSSAPAVSAAAAEPAEKPVEAEPAESPAADESAEIPVAAETVEATVQEVKVEEEVKKDEAADQLAE